MRKKRGLQLTGLLIAAGLIIAINLLPFGQWLNTFREVLENAGSAGTLLFIFAGTLAALFFVPVSVPVTVAGLFFGFPGGLLPAAAVLAAGTAGGFAVGRLLWPEIKHLRIFTRPVFQAVRKALEHDGHILLALLRMTPVMHFMTSNIFFGSLNIRFWPYLLHSLLGMIPGTLLVVYAGSVTSSMFGEEESVSFWQWVLFGGGLLLFAAISWRVSRKTRRILQSSDGDKSTDRAQ
jgi:uncharacterized membrane protein YdjX (TVP38/TMEM64 family)